LGAGQISRWGRHLGASFTQFRDGLDLSNELADDLPPRQAFEEQLAAVFEKIQSFSVRETKDSAGIELPEKL
jgi:hypothetical protein